MGVKDWFAGKVAGPQSYGDVMGRQARENGAALANVVFISHGTRRNVGATTIFDTAADMEAAGFTPRFTEIVKLDLNSLTKDEQLVLRSLTTAMMSFAFIVSSNAALQYMTHDNTSKFRNGLGPSLLRSMVECRLFDRIEAAQAEVVSYANSMDSKSTSAVLNMERPGAGDVLEQFIVRAVELSGSRLQHGFKRTGVTGFDLVAIPLAQETVKSIYGATVQYKW